MENDFSPDLSKQAQEVILDGKIKKLLHPILLFNNILLKNGLFQKHLGLTLDIKLNFSEYIKNKNITKKKKRKKKNYGSFTQISTNFAKVISSHYIQNFYKKSVRLCRCHF